MSLSRGSWIFFFSSTGYAFSPCKTAPALPTSTVEALDQQGRLVQQLLSSSAGATGGAAAGAAPKGPILCLPRLICQNRHVNMKSGQRRHKSFAEATHANRGNPWTEILAYG